MLSGVVCLIYPHHLIPVRQTHSLRLLGPHCMVCQDIFNDVLFRLEYIEQQTVDFIYRGLGGCRCFSEEIFGFNFCSFF